MYIYSIIPLLEEKKTKKSTNARRIGTIGFRKRRSYFPFGFGAEVLLLARERKR